jgi:hypothetical protein
MNIGDVRAVLARDEPDYEQAARDLGPAALPYLRTLVAAADPAIAPKAVYLAGLIDSAGAADSLRTAVESDDVRIRLAAAGTARILTGDFADRVLIPLLLDVDPGVRRLAVRSVGDSVSPRLQAALERSAADETEPHIRQQLQDVLSRVQLTARSDGTTQPAGDPPIAGNGPKPSGGRDARPSTDKQKGRQHRNPRPGDQR